MLCRRCSFISCALPSQTRTWALRGIRGHSAAFPRRASRGSRGKVRLGRLLCAPGRTSQHVARDTLSVRPRRRDVRWASPAAGPGSLRSGLGLSRGPSDRNRRHHEKAGHEEPCRQGSTNADTWIHHLHLLHAAVDSAVRRAISRAGKKNRVAHRAWLCPRGPSSGLEA
jgi:hypothetical protein